MAGIILNLFCMQFKWSKENSVHILKVLGFLVAANAVGTGITFLQDVEFPKDYALYVSLTNAILVALKEWLSEKR